MYRNYRIQKIADYLKVAGDAGGALGLICSMKRTEQTLFCEKACFPADAGSFSSWSSLCWKKYH